MLDLRAGNGILLFPVPRFHSSIVDLLLAGRAADNARFASTTADAGHRTSSVASV
jgi:hypothetical protein